MKTKLFSRTTMALRYSGSEGPWTKIASGTKENDSLWTQD